MKRTVCACILLLSMTVSSCAGGNSAGVAMTPAASAQLSPPVAAANTAALPSVAPEMQGVVYRNAQYGFDFLLPNSWRGYFIVEKQWEGWADTGSQAGNAAETGPEIIIRPPQWTSEDPYQDIPILIFTLAQWDALGQESFHIGAAPIGPGELGRNDLFVFALPARYNYAYLPGYEEVEKIIESQPLRPFHPVKAAPVS